MTEPRRQLYPTIEPYETGMLDVGEGHSLYWERVGTPGAKPAVFPVSYTHLTLPTILRV